MTPLERFDSEMRIAEKLRLLAYELTRQAQEVENAAFSESGLECVEQRWRIDGVVGWFNWARDAIEAKEKQPTGTTQ